MPKKSVLQQELGKRRPFDDPTQEAYLNLQRTAALLASDFTTFFKQFGVSEATYNALRILRGATLGPEAPGRRTCGEIGRDLVTAVPDVTRLIDRLVEQGYAERDRSVQDRRVVYVRITKRGLSLLAKMDGALIERHRGQLGHLSKGELTELSRLLERAREAVALARDEG